MTITEKIIKYYDVKIRMKLVWLILIISLTLALWKGVDFDLTVVIISCVIYILLEHAENKLCRETFEIDPRGI